MSNQQNKLTTRVARPQTLGAALGGLIKIFGGHASDADLATRWSEIMGRDIGEISTLSGIRKTKDGKFNIAVRPKNPAFALQLSYQSDDIAKRINKYFGYDAVNKITFRK